MKFKKISVGLLLLAVALCPCEADAQSQGKEADANNDRFPEHSLDRIPRFMYSTSDKMFSRKELDFVAEHYDWITVANGNGSDSNKSYGEAIEKTARELKRRNPNIKIIYYWNAARCTSDYFENNRTFKESWDLQTNGNLGYDDKGVAIPYTDQKGGVPDVTISECRDWWVESAIKQMNIPGVDGIWVDAAGRLYNPSTNKKWKKAGIWRDSKDGEMGAESAYFEMYERILEYAKANGKFVVGNFLRPENNTPYEKIWQYFDGGFIEDHYSFLDAKAYRDSFLGYTDSKGVEHKGLIANVQQAVEMDKIVGFYLCSMGYDFDEGYKKKHRPTQSECRDYIIEKAPLSIAAYLLLADKGVYLQYSAGFGRSYSAFNLVDDQIPQFQYRLGEPKSPAIINGDVVTREFEHASVRVDFSTLEAVTIWEDAQ